MRGGAFVVAWRCRSSSSRGIAVEIWGLVVVVVRGSSGGVFLGIALDLKTFTIGDVDEA